MRKVILESPYAGEVALNVAYARACMRDCLSRGEATFVAHLLYTQPGVLDDGVPRERDFGIFAGLEWGGLADVTVVYDDLGVSKGMELGIAQAIKAGRPVERRKLPGFDLFALRIAADQPFPITATGEDAQCRLIGIASIANNQKNKTERLLLAERETTARLRAALAAAVKVADEAREEWDSAPSGMKAGKLLIALSGGCPRYRADIDEIHAALKGAA